MVPDAEAAGARWSSEGDPRITVVGNFLRRSRLDEFPQFLNILRGEMSLIGPRPERPEFVTDLSRAIPFYRARHAIKPGLTGWAQVMYRYGSSEEDTLVKLQYDLYYIKHRSPELDIRIAAKTFKVILSGGGR
jgi:lipopolysaccharide/colanic/teichoic acid biosynthesis glycosyltransferase